MYVQPSVKHKPAIKHKLQSYYMMIGLFDREGGGSASKVSAFLKTGKCLNSRTKLP